MCDVTCWDIQNVTCWDIPKNYPLNPIAGVTCVMSRVTCGDMPGRGRRMPGHGCRGGDPDHDDHDHGGHDDINDNHDHGGDHDVNDHDGQGCRGGDDGDDRRSSPTSPPLHPCPS